MIKGVDLSTHNRGVDYQSLKDSGVEFAILRIGYGKDAGQRDAMFDEHYRGCKSVGIKVGAYHYSYCNRMENAIKEVENCLRYLDGIELDLPVFYDLEDKMLLNAGINITEIGLIFCRKIKENGYDAGVYSNLDWFNNYVNPYTLLNENIKIWLAQWNNEITADFPIDIWQNTNHNEFGYDGDFLVNESLLNNNDTPTLDVNIYQSLAVDVIKGIYGNGQKRKNALGVFYEKVQNIVNDIYNKIGG